MKTLSEIINAVKAGEKPDYEDLRFALIAMDALHNRSFMALLKLASREREGKYNPKMFGLQHQAEERFKCLKAALAIPPKEYVGESHNPDNPEVQAFRQTALKVWAIAEQRCELQNPS